MSNLKSFFGALIKCKEIIDIKGTNLYNGKTIHYIEHHIIPKNNPGVKAHIIICTNDIKKKCLVCQGRENGKSINEIATSVLKSFGMDNRVGNIYKKFIIAFWKSTN